jgi:hypothetical protein
VEPCCVCVEIEGTAEFNFEIITGKKSMSFTGAIFV